jgi:hypothetical protein
MAAPTPVAATAAARTAAATPTRIDPPASLAETHRTMDLTKAKAATTKWLVRLGIGIPALMLLAATLYVFFTLNFVYSKGERVGFVQKLSKRGWLCKTNEGDLAMVNMAGQQAEIFAFTVPDDKVSKEIESFAGHRVELQYEEHRGIPSNCFGDTSYFVVGVRKTE